MDQQQPGQITIRFGDTHPNWDRHSADVLRDAQTFFDQLRQNGQVGRVETWINRTEPGGQIQLQAPIDQLVNLALNDRYRDQLVQLRLCFLDFSVVVAQGGANGATSQVLQEIEEVQNRMHSEYQADRSSQRQGATRQ